MQHRLFTMPRSFATFQTFWGMWHTPKLPWQCFLTDICWKTPNLPDSRVDAVSLQQLFFDKKKHLFLALKKTIFRPNTAKYCEKVEKSHQKPIFALLLLLLNSDFSTSKTAEMPFRQKTGHLLPTHTISRSEQANFWVENVR